MEIKFEPIGTIYTPYFSENTPHQPIQDAPGEFWIDVRPDLIEGLRDLEKFRYIYVLYYLDKVQETPRMTVSPPWASGAEVGLFASRSPNRPNPIGLSIVEIKEITDHEISISGIDVYNGTPLLDIKPYIHTIDVKPDANDGWIDALQDKSHMLAHMLGRPHEHSHEHGHEHNSVNEHHHNHVHPHETTKDHLHVHNHFHHEHSHHEHNHEHNHGHEHKS